MANPAQEQILGQGVAAWNSWRNANTTAEIDLENAALPTDLKGVDFHGANLKGVVVQNGDFQDANLRGANLDGAALPGAKFYRGDLQGADLRRTNLSGAQFRVTDMSGADLSDIDLRGLVLHEVKFIKANLRDTRLEDSDLQDADFTGAVGLQSKNLAGADLNNARLPDAILKFDGLAQVAELSKNAGALFLSMLLACVYAWLTIATTTDVQLITNSASSKLPIIQTEIPIVAFYWVGPLILLGVFINFHLYMQRLWETMATLPAVFPDGMTLDKKSYPWLLNELVSAHFKRLRNRRAPLHWLQERLSILLAWFITPLTLVFFWLRYLKRHDWIGIVLLIVICGLCAKIAAETYRLAVSTLRGESTVDSAVAAPFRHKPFYRQSAITAGLIISLGLISFIAIERRMANVYLEEADISTKPPNWTDKSGDSLVKGANLRSVDLRYAEGVGAFMVNANLLEANLSGANLPIAFLTNALLTRADLTGAIIEGAQLKKAICGNANFSRATLADVDFTGAILEEANLAYTYSSGADFSGADLLNANLTAGDFSFANFSGAKLLQANLTAGDFSFANFSGVKLTHAIFADADFSSAKLSRVDLTNADLSRTKFGGADLSKAILSKANLRGVSLTGANLSGANLTKADLTGASLFGANLSGANLTNANLSDTMLLDVNLTKANLSGANLTGGTFLEVKQVQSAIVSWTTRLPSNLKLIRKAKKP